MLEIAATMDENQPSEFAKFFEDLPVEDKAAANIFDEASGENKPAEQAGDGKNEPANGDEPRKNRHHRRLEKQLADEKEARIAAEARAKAFAEVGAQAKAEDVDERLIRMYGPEHLEAAKLHMELLNDFEARAKKAAISEMETRQATRADEVRQFEATVVSELEGIEDEYNVKLTGDDPVARKQRTELLDLVKKLSPKNEDGTIAAYADFAETWELYQLKQAKPATNGRAREAAARSMESGGTGQTAPAAPTPGFRGWMKDFNVSQ